MAQKKLKFVIRQVVVAERVMVGYLSTDYKSPHPFLVPLFVAQDLLFRVFRAIRKFEKKKNKRMNEALEVSNSIFLFFFFFNQSSLLEYFAFAFSLSFSLCLLKFPSTFTLFYSYISQSLRERERELDLGLERRVLGPG